MITTFQDILLHFPGKNAWFYHTKKKIEFPVRIETNRIQIFTGSRRVGYTSTNLFQQAFISLECFIYFLFE